MPSETVEDLSAPMPAPPVRQFSFTDFQVNNPTAPPPGDRLDAEFDRANNAIEDTITWASVSLNSDGSIRDGAIGNNQLVSGLFDDVAQDIIDEVQPLVDQAASYAAAASASKAAAAGSATAAAASNTSASGAASSATAAANTAVAARNTAQTYATTAQTAATNAANADNHATGEAALAQDYADVTQAWAEHMPDTIPPNILAVMGVTGSHWSSRWWANQAGINSKGGGAYVGAAPPGDTFAPLWWDSVSGQLFIQYNDGNSSQWVSANSAASGPFLPLSGGHVTGKVQIGSTGWLSPIIGGTEENSLLVSLSTWAGSGGVFGTRTSDGGATGGQGAWAIGGFAINNSTTAVQTAWGQYIEVRRYPNTGTTHGMEIATINHGDLKQNSPYYLGQSGSTIGLWLSAGRDDVTPDNNLSLAIGIEGSHARFDRGIVFEWNSVNVAGQTGAVAIGLPYQYSVVWYIDDGGASQGAGQVGAIIRSDVTSVAGLQHPPLIALGNGQLVFDPGNDIDTVVFETGLATFQTDVSIVAPAVGETMRLHVGTGSLTANTISSVGDLNISPGSGGRLQTFVNRNFPSVHGEIVRYDYNVNGAVTAGQQPILECHAVDSDAADASLAQGGGLSWWTFTGNLAAGAVGGRTAFGATLTQSGATTSAVGQYYVAGAFFATATHSAGGAAGARRGELFASNDGAFLTAGSGLYWNNVIGYEVDITAETGTGCAYKTGISVVSWATDRVAGSGNADMAYTIAAQSTCAGWDVGFCIGAPSGWWPMKATSSLIGTRPSAVGGGPAYAAAWGVDFSAVAFSGGLIRGPGGFSVDGSGVLASVKSNAGFRCVTSATAATRGDLSKHLDLYSGQYGVNVQPSGNINIVSGASIEFSSGNTFLGQIDNTGLNYTPIGATGASTGNFSQVAVGGTKVLGNQITGWGTPTGPSRISNFPGASATLVQCSNAIAQIIADLKTHGMLGA